MNNKFEALKSEEIEDDENLSRNKRNKTSPENEISSVSATSNSLAPVTEHRLQYPYSLWFSSRTPGKQNGLQSYDQNLKLVGTFSTVEKFWAIYSHLMRPSDLGSHSDFHLFKDGIKPMWEDDANKDGGKWIVRLKKGLASRCWENLILAILGEQFMVGEEICGAVVSVRYAEDIISVWNKSAGEQATTIRIRDTLKRVLNLPPNTIMEYKTHNNSLRDNSSFRNTDIFLR